MTLSWCALYISWDVSDIWQIEAQREKEEVNQMRNDPGQNEGFGGVDGDSSMQMTAVQSLMPSTWLKLNESVTLSIWMTIG